MAYATPEQEAAAAWRSFNTVTMYCLRECEATECGGCDRAKRVVAANERLTKAEERRAL